MNKFAVAFRKARLNSDKTFREIADYIGKSIGYLSDIENGRKNPPETYVVRKIEEFFGINDGHLSKLANEVRSTLPTNLNSLVRAKPQLGELLLRGDEMMPDELDELIRELIEKARKKSLNNNSEDNSLLYLNDFTIRYFAGGYANL